MSEGQWYWFGPFCIWRANGGGFSFVRLGAWVLWWKDTRRHMLVFSERYGYRRTWRLGRWAGALEHRP